MTKYGEIRSVSTNLIATKGYGGTSFQEIADNVGLHKSSLFHYFKSKEELLFRTLGKSIDEVEVATAKYFACRSAKAADIAMEIYSSYGFSMGYPIQRCVRDSRAFVITEGTSNIQKMIIARRLIS